MSPVVDRTSSELCVARSGQFRRRWREVLTLSPHTHGSAGILGGESVGDQLQNTLQIVHVSALLTPCR